jgi:hypothetical protein
MREYDRRISDIAHELSSEACLNHVSGAKAGVAGVYNRAVYAAEKKAALERWAAHVENLTSGKPAANVVALHKAHA